jgi:hypothetical protein
MARNKKILGPDAIRLPAIFWSGECLIAVSASSGGPPPEIKAAPLLYDRFWPSVREGVLKIMKGCPATWGSNGRDLGGLGRGQLKEGGWILSYSFSVHGFSGMGRDISDAVRTNFTGPVLPWSLYNIYHHGIRINDVKWPIPFQRPR